MIREHEIRSDQTQGPMAVQVQVETAASHETDFVIASKEFGRQAMRAYESFEKRGKTGRAKGILGPTGKFVEFGVGNSLGQPSLTAAQVRAGVAGQADPAVKIVSDAGACSTWVRPKRVTKGGHPSWKR